MRNILTILLLLIAVACNNSPRPPLSDSTIDEKTSGPQLDTIPIVNKQAASHYYHSFDTVPFSAYLKDSNLDSTVRSYCQEKFHIDVDDSTIKFLELISSKNDKYFELYFAIFNNILINSDGAVAELMGPYCFKFVINYPNEILMHFVDNSHDLYLYTMFLGAEFYFKSQMTSNIKYSFPDFKKYLTSKLDSNNVEVKNISKIFYAKIDSMMLEMN